MSLVALAADKGAPGVTTACVALAAVWPRPALVAECDPSGGDLEMRLHAPGGAALRPGRGLLSYAAAVRRGSAPLREHVQEAEGGLGVLLGLQSAEQASGLSGLWPGIAAGLAQEPSADVVADCGRLGPASPVVDVLRRADLVLLLTRPALDAAVHLRERLAVLLPQLVEQGRRTDVGVLVVAPVRHDTAAAEVAGVLEQAGLDVPVLGRLAHDAEAAGGLAGQPARRLDRSWLVRSAREVALQLDERLASRGAA